MSSELCQSCGVIITRRVDVPDFGVAQFCARRSCRKEHEARLEWIKAHPGPGAGPQLTMERILELLGGK